MYSDCPSEENTYISWTCTPNKNKVCQHVQSKWENVQAVASSADENIMVLFAEFKNMECFGKDGQLLKDKKGNPVTRIIPVKKQVDVQYLLSFISKLLPENINHRNMLQLYRSINKEFKDLFSSVVMDIDFSENLTLEVKFQPQSLHWYKHQVTVHFGIVKCSGNKTYHPYVSNDRSHNPSFVKMAMQGMMDYSDMSDGSVIIESDNCCSQYKSSQHFHDMQDIANTSGWQIIRIYSVAGHGKGEVDNVGGVAKVAVRQEISRGAYFSNAAEVVSFLEEKFGEKKFPEYEIKEILPENLEELRASAAKKNFNTVDGSSFFHVIIFQPGASTMKASNRLCICSQCKFQIGSCASYNEYELQYEDIYPAQLRSSVLQKHNSSGHGIHERTLFGKTISYKIFHSVST